MKSVVKHPYDAELAFRAPGSAAITASANSNAVALDFVGKGRGAYANSLGSQAYAVCILVAALDTGNADETYNLALEFDDADDFGSAVAVADIDVAETGVYTLNVDADTAEKLIANPTHARIAATLGGTTPSLTYSAWLAPVVK